MMRRTATLFAALALFATGCSDFEPAHFDSIAPDTTTAPTITSTTQASPTTTSTPTVAVSPLSTRLGIGDSLYDFLGNGGYDVSHYTVDLTYDPEPNAIGARVEIEATATMPIQQLSLDFVGFDISNVTLDGEAVDFGRRNGKLIITAPSVINETEQFTVAVSYSGEPAPMRSEALPFELGWLTDRNGVSYVVAEPDAGRSWLPLNDHPSDKATYTFKITVPDPLVAAANGILTETITDLGWATWVWESRDPMASYLATVVIGNLEIVPDEASSGAAGIPVRNVLPDDLSPQSLATLEKHGEMITFFESIFGPYPFEAYGLAVVDGFDAALENQTLSIFGRSMVDFTEFFETVMVHELAHQWFGNSVTPTDWRDIWLNEGFATYAEWLWLEYTRGTDAMLATVQGERNRMALSALPPPGSPPADDLFNSSVYNWGGLVLHALRVEVGDDAFFDTLRTYAASFRHRNATTAEFIDVAESVSGRELSDLFNRWLYSETVPELP